MSATVELQHESDYRFAARFGPAIPVVRSDLAPPLGGGTGPTPEHLLAAAVATCLASSLRFALVKFKQAPDPMRAVATATEGRNAQNRLRVQALKVAITLGVPAARLEHLERALASFEEFCTVTASVRAAVPVEVEVFDSEGRRLR